MPMLIYSMVSHKSPKLSSLLFILFLWLQNFKMNCWVCWFFFFSCWPSLLLNSSSEFFSSVIAFFISKILFGSFLYSLSFCWTHYIHLSFFWTHCAFLMVVILNSLSSNSYTFISLRSVFADLFCPFDWTIFPCFLMLLITLCWYMLIFAKKPSHLSVFRTALYKGRPSPNNLPRDSGGPLRLFCGCFFSGLVQCRSVAPRHLEYIRSCQHPKLCQTETSPLGSCTTSQGVGCLLHSFPPQGEAANMHWPLSPVPWVPLSSSRLHWSVWALAALRHLEYASFRPCSETETSLVGSPLEN